MSNPEKNKFDIICNTVDNGIIVLNKDLKVFFWNRWLETRTGIEANSIIDKNILDFYSNIDEKKLKRKIITALKLNSPTFYTPQTDDFLINIEINNISDRVFNQMQQSITITPLDLEEGLVILYIYDITFLSEINYKLEIAKKSLSEKNEELRLILDTTMEAIIIFKDNSVVDCNKIAIELFNKQMKYELINKSFNDLIHNKNRDILNEKEPFETNLIREDGSEFNAIINIKDTSLNNQIFKIVTIVDIEDLKRKENLMAEQTKLAAMGEMLGNIAHQWRQPLSVITATASGMLIQKEMGAHQWRQPLNIISMSSSNLKLKNDIGELCSSTLSESLSLILRTTNHLSDTIDTFNDFLKTDKEKSFFNVNENIKNSISLVDSFFKNFNIDIILELEEGIFINSLANEFSQAFINILNNAKDAIVLNLKDNEYGLIKIKTKKIDNFIEISILDNAKGIEKDILNKIFEPYFTTKHKYQGTGLGLYMTRKIINSSMGGEITVQNKKFVHNQKKYEGAEFKIKIPIKLD
ncbi:MAG TPA: ATP-binding protein [Aliarcobacter cryaerophilus]|nr:ATP-binding protein [Aliarcobacter cryaerophilus]